MAFISSQKADRGVRHSSALQNFGEYNLPLDQHPFPHPVHSRPKEQLSKDHRNPTGTQHHGRAPARTANSHVVTEDPHLSPTAQLVLSHVEPNWLAALGGGRVVLSQGGENTFINHTVQGELQRLTVTQLYTAANRTRAGILPRSLPLCQCYKGRIKNSKDDWYAFRHKGCPPTAVGGLCL